MCWGAGEQGQIGAPAFVSSTLRQHDIDSIFDAKQVAVGDEFSCALSQDGVVRCWGKDIPDLFPGANAVPQQRFVRLVHGGGSSTNSHLVALSSQGELFRTRAFEGFLAVPLPARVSALQPEWPSETGSSIALLENGDVYFLNGDGAPRMLTVPRPVERLVSDMPCVKYKDGTFGCWGRNDDALLGAPEAVASQKYNVKDLPVSRPISDLFDVPMSTTLEERARCALEVTGDLTCWGTLSYKWHYFNGPYSWVGNHMPHWDVIVDTAQPRRLNVGTKLVQREDTCFLDASGGLWVLYERCLGGVCRLVIEKAPGVGRVSQFSAHDIGRCIAELREGGKVVVSLESDPGQMGFDPTRWPSQHIVAKKIEEPSVGVRSERAARSCAVELDHRLYCGGQAMSEHPVVSTARDGGIACAALAEGGIRCWSALEHYNLDGLTDPLMAHLPRRLFEHP